MIPWKESGSESVEEDLKVPVKATMISTGSIIFIVMMMPVVHVTITSADKNYIWFVIYATATVALSIPSLLLIFTVSFKVTDSIKINRLGS